MKKTLIWRLYGLIATMLVLFLMPGVDFRWGGEKEQIQSQASSFFDAEWKNNLQHITGMIVEMPNPNFVSQYLGMLEESKKLAIQTYELTEKRVKSWLEKQARLGMKIQIMIENKKYQQYQNTFKNLQNAFSSEQNIAIKSDEHLPTQYLHGKITLVESGFWLQSSNLTHSTFAKNREHLFWSENAEVLASLWKIFEKDRK